MLNPHLAHKADSEQCRWAVLIDAENTSYNTIDAVLAEIASLGVIVVKRIYGDFSHPSLTSWKDQAMAHGLAPVHCFRSVTGKSNSDMALAIDAMDWLHSGQVDGICLVTSDSDFAPLALRIKEGGRLAYGFGRQITPKSFVNAVHRFFYIETLIAEPVAPAGTTPVATVPPSATESAVLSLTAAQKEIALAVTDLAQDDGWANLAGVGNLMIKRFPDFSPRNYNCAKLLMLIDRMKNLEVRRESGLTVMVRVKPAGSRHAAHGTSGAGATSDAPTGHAA